MKKFRIIFIFNLICCSVNAQSITMILSGEVKYDFRVNQYERARKILGDQVRENRYRDYVQSLANQRFSNSGYTLEFNNNYSSFKCDQKKPSVKTIDFVVDMQTQLVLKDLKTDSIYIEKNIAGEVFRISDKRVPIIWKYTNERMNILGYECRRANGLMADSVYVVAFYCPDIPISSGPSIFSGLPGLILGVSIPHDNINIFATNLNIKDPVINPKHKISQPTKSFKEYMEFMSRTFFSDEKQQQRFKFNLRTIYL